MREPTHHERLALLTALDLLEHEWDARAPGPSKGDLGVSISYLRELLTAGPEEVERG